jgi:GNAT superfamily N-acetyltransferase
MIVRSATPADLPACLAVDASYRTAQVWQMRVQRGDVLGESEDILHVTFRPVRLPRPIMLTPPGLKARLTQTWQRRALTLVLEDEEEGTIHGYLGAEILLGQRLGWVDIIAIAPEMRQQRGGIRLMEEAIVWGRAHGLRALVLETQARNAPIVAMAQQMGFTFSGYHEQFYDEAEVALFFTLPLG